MKSFIRNEQSNHMKALSLIEEFDRLKLRRIGSAKGRNRSDLQHALNPKRLLCFSNKAKKHEYPEENLTEPEWRSMDVTNYETGQNSLVKDKRRNHGDLSALCNELCQDYYEIRKKLKNRPAVRTREKAEIQYAIAGSNSTASSSVDAPLRYFDSPKQRRKSKVHYSNGNRDLHRRQPSLLDDNGSVHVDRKHSSSRSSVQKLNRNSFSSRVTNSIQSRGTRSRNSERSDKNKRKSRRSENLIAISKRSYRERPTKSKRSMSESTDYTVPVSAVERNDTSSISTMTSRSYSVYHDDDSSVILSPRGANDKVDKNVNQGGLLICSSAPCSSNVKIPRRRDSRNPGVEGGGAYRDLGVIREGDDYYSSSASSESYSSYVSSSAGSYSDYSYSSHSDEEDYDPSVSYSRTSTRKKKKKNIMARYSTVGSDDVWNATVERRDDHY